MNMYIYIYIHIECERQTGHPPREAPHRFRRNSKGQGSCAPPGTHFCVLQCVAHLIALVCCSVLQCGAVCCSAWQCVAVCCSVVQCGAVCCSALQCVAVCCSVLQCVAHSIARVLQCVAVCCSVWQFIAVCCSMSHIRQHLRTYRHALCRNTQFSNNDFEYFSSNFQNIVSAPKLQRPLALL